MKKTLITRKLTTVGESRGISLPKTWIDYTEQKAGKRIVEIALEVNSTITLSPIFENNRIVRRKDKVNSEVSESGTEPKSGRL